MPLLFMVIEQDMAQRCFAAKSARVVSWASGIAALSILGVCAIPVFYGILGRNLGLEIAPGASVFMTVIKASTTPALMALVACAILAAIISTADSLINAISSNIAQDFTISSKSNVRRSQLISALIGVTALFCSIYCTNVVSILMQSYELSVSCLFVPIVAGLFLRKGNKQSAAWAVSLGALSFLLVRLLPIDFLPKEVFSLLISALGFGVSELYLYLRRQKALEPI